MKGELVLLSLSVLLLSHLPFAHEIIAQFDLSQADDVLFANFVDIFGRNYTGEEKEMRFNAFQVISDYLIALKTYTHH